MKKIKEEIFGKYRLFFKEALIDDERCVFVSKIENINHGTKSKDNYYDTLLLPETFNGLPVRGYDSINSGFCSIVFPKSIKIVRVRLNSYLRKPVYINEMENQYCLYIYSYIDDEKTSDKHFELAMYNDAREGKIIDYEKLSSMTLNLHPKYITKDVVNDSFSNVSMRDLLTSYEKKGVINPTLFLSIKDSPCHSVYIFDGYVGELEVECHRPNVQVIENDKLLEKEYKEENKEINEEKEGKSVLSILGKILLIPINLLINLFKGLSKIVTSDIFKNISKVVMVLALVFSVVLGVGYGLFSLGKVIVNGVSSLFQSWSFKLENTCYYDNGIIIEDSTCTEQGKIKYTCLRHGEEKEEDLPLKHNFLEHCECVTCGYLLENEYHIDYATNLNYSTGTPHVIGEGENKYISMKYQYGQYTELDHDIIIPQYLSTKEGKLLPVKEVDLTYKDKYNWHRKYQNITIYVPDGYKTNIKIGNFAIENLTVIGNVDTLVNYDSDIKTYVKNITIYGDLDNLVSNYAQHEKLESFRITGEIKNIDFDFFRETKIEQINLSKETESIKNLDKLKELKKLCNIYVPEGNEYYKSIEGVLYSSDIKELLLYPDGRKANYFVVPDGVEVLGNLYTEYHKFKKVVIPTTVNKFIPDDARNNVGNKRKIYFMGSEDLFYEKFPNGVSNDDKYTKIYFYSEEKIKDGKHWHYNKFNNPKVW